MMFTKFSMTFDLVMCYKNLPSYVDMAAFCRYWQNNMNNVKAYKSAHKESVRDLRYLVVASMGLNLK